MTVTAIVLSVLGWAAGRPAAEMGLMVVAFVAPQLAAWMIPLLILRGLREARVGHGSDVLILVAVAAELRAGSTLRGALAAVGSGEPRLARAASMARAGRPLSQVLDAAAAAFGRFGALVTAAMGMAGSTGGSAVVVVDQLVAQLMALDELERERRAAMAPILLQAGVVGGVPLAVLIGMAGSGRLLELVGSGSFGAAVVVIGTGSILAGSGLVLRIARRAVKR